jgi:hypothetical protein
MIDSDPVKKVAQLFEEATRLQEQANSVMPKL